MGQRQAVKAGIGFTALSNGFATCDDPTGLQDVTTKPLDNKADLAGNFPRRIPMPHRCIRLDDSRVGGLAERIEITHAGPERNFV